MAVTQGESSFGQKLDWLKKTFGGTDDEIGTYVGASAALVCRWRHGQRNLDRIRDESVFKGLVEFFIKRAELTGQTHIIADITGSHDMTADSEECRLALLSFLYDSSPIPNESKAESPEIVIPVRKECYFGVDGLIDALSLLAQRAQGAPLDLTVYLSLEHARLMLNESAERLWEALWRCGGGSPVQLIFDHWTDAEEATKTLRGLLPFMQTGRLRLNLIKSTQKYFYSNITFYAAGAGIIVTTNPAGGQAGSVSMLVDSPKYISNMGDVFAKFYRNTKPIEKHMEATAKEESGYYTQLYTQGSDLKTMIDGVNLLYMSSDAYMILLKQNKIIESKRSYRQKKFIKDKQQFEEYLEANRMTEILCLEALDRMIELLEIKTPDFSFRTGMLKTDKVVLTSLISGMLDYLGRYGNLSILFNRNGQRCEDFSCRLKGDSFVLLHTYGSNPQHIVWSDTWLLVYEYIRQFDESMHSEDLITTREAVISALRMRLGQLNENMIEKKAQDELPTRESVKESVSKLFGSQYLPHVDADAFRKLVLREVVLSSYVEQLAQRLHENYLKGMRAAGDSDHSSAVAWDELPEDLRNANRAQASNISEHLHKLGYDYDYGETVFPPVKEFNKETTLLLAQNEHIRWMNERFASGWKYGPERDNEKKIHPLLVEWDLLPKREKKKNIDIARSIIPLLKSIGLQVYQTIEADSL